jgi:hypothetical protein
VNQERQLILHSGVRGGEVIRERDMMAHDVMHDLMFCCLFTDRVIMLQIRYRTDGNEVKREDSISNAAGNS